MNRTLIAEDAGAELYKRGFDVRTNDTEVEVSLPGLLVIVSAESPHCTRAWMWRKNGEAEDETDHNTAFEASAGLAGDATRSRKAGFKSVLLCLRNLLAGYLDVRMADHVEHVKEQADLGKGGITEEQMASLGLLDIEGINVLNESLAKVEEAIKESR